jgi:hypothetical protein
MEISGMELIRELANLPLKEMNGDTSSPKIPRVNQPLFYLFVKIKPIIFGQEDMPLNYSVST